MCDIWIYIFLVGSFTKAICRQFQKLFHRTPTSQNSWSSSSTASSRLQDLVVYYEPRGTSATVRHGAPEDCGASNYNGASSSLRTILLVSEPGTSTQLEGNRPMFGPTKLTRQPTPPHIARGKGIKDSFAQYQLI